MALKSQTTIFEENLGFGRNNDAQKKKENNNNIVTIKRDRVKCIVESRLHDGRYM